MRFAVAMMNATVIATIAIAAAVTTILTMKLSTLAIAPLLTLNNSHERKRLPEIGQPFFFLLHEYKKNNLPFRELNQ